MAQFAAIFLCQNLITSAVEYARKKIIFGLVGIGARSALPVVAGIDQARRFEVDCDRASQR